MLGHRATETMVGKAYKQGKQVVVALVIMFTLREDASVIDTLYRKAVIRFQANEGTFEKVKKT